MTYYHALCCAVQTQQEICKYSRAKEKQGLQGLFFHIYLKFLHKIVIREPDSLNPPQKHKRKPSIFFGFSIKKKEARGKANVNPTITNHLIPQEISLQLSTVSVTAIVESNNLLTLVFVENHVSVELSARHLSTVYVFSCYGHMGNIICIS